MSTALPRYEYSRLIIQRRLQELTSLEAPFGLTTRYAVKANPHPEIIKLIDTAGVEFDASSSYEADELLEMGIEGNKISLSSQQSTPNLAELLEQGVLYVATSMRQLRDFIAAANHPDTVGIRINIDMGVGHNKRTSTGGATSAFGLWYEYIPEALALAKENDVIIDRLHIHVGSGSDPKVWGEVMDRSLSIATQLPDVIALDIGGGFKVHRYDTEKEADMSVIMELFSSKLENFAAETGRELRLEIEPGTYLIAHAGTLVATVDDIVDTGADGFTFLRINTGMNDFLRTAMYGAQHKIEVINNDDETKEYIVVGHNCESGDIFTPTPGDPEEIEPRMLNKAEIGDEIRIYDVGAYGASMRAKGYNSFPDAVEVIVD